MFGNKRNVTVIAEGLKIVGSVTAEGVVEVDGQVEGEVHCTSLIVSRDAQIAGTITADRIVVDGRVEGPIKGGDVILKSQARVAGDIHHTSLTIEKGALFDGRSVQARSSEGYHAASTGRKRSQATDSTAEAA